MVSRSTNIKQAFDVWIQNETWHTGHPLDEMRFYRFVWTVVTCARRRPSVEAVRLEIQHVWQGKLEAHYLLCRAIAYSQLFETLWEFARSKRSRSPTLPSWSALNTLQAAQVLAARGDG